MRDKPTTVEALLRDARFLRDHAAQAADVDYITFGLATEYLRAIVGNEWTNQHVFGMHPIVDPGSRAGRAFMRAEATATPDRFRNQERPRQLAEMLFNLRNVEGFASKLEQLRSDLLESAYAELEMGAFLLQRDVTFRYVVPIGVMGSDYDAKITLRDGSTTVSCEMKCKVESTAFSAKTVLSRLNKAVRQMPADVPGLIFLKVPEAWLSNPEIARLLPTLDAFLQRNSGVVALILRWERQQLVPPRGALTSYEFRLQRSTTSTVVSALVEALLTSLAGPARTPATWVSFRSIAEVALRR